MEFCISSCSPLLSCFAIEYRRENSGSISILPPDQVFTHIWKMLPSLLFCRAVPALTSPGVMDAGGSLLDSPCLSQAGESSTGLSRREGSSPHGALPNSWRTRDTALPRAHLPFQGSWVNLSYLVLLLPLLSDPNPEINLMHLLINYHIQSI